MPHYEIFKTYNCNLLRQLTEVLQACPEDVYAFVQEPWLPFPISAHVRHVLDHYSCFLQGVCEGAINYDLRERSADLEQNKAQMLAHVAQLLESVEALDAKAIPEKLLICNNARAGELWSSSTVEREWQFLEAHTVHHYAIMAMVLRKKGIAVSPSFGIAPSTWRYWEEQKQCAR